MPFLKKRKKIYGHVCRLPEHLRLWTGGTYRYEAGTQWQCRRCKRIYEMQKISLGGSCMDWKLIDE